MMRLFPARRPLRRGASDNTLSAMISRHVAAQPRDRDNRAVAPVVDRPLAPFLLGTMVLVAGAVFYRIERALPLFDSWLPSAAAWHAPYLRTFAGQAPSFLHAFAFSCMTGAYCAPTLAGRARACLLWLLVNGAIECAQLPVVRRSLGVWTPFGNSVGIGTFDPLDLAAILLGSVCAFGLLTLVSNARHR